MDPQPQLRSSHTDVKNQRHACDARFRKQEQVTRERDAVWAEYVASYHAIDTKTARLKKMRLARIAADEKSVATSQVVALHCRKPRSSMSRRAGVVR